MGWLDKVMGPAEGADLERRLLTFICGALATFATLMGGIALTADGGSVLLSFGSALVFLGLWVGSRRGLPQAALVWALLVAGLVILLLEWLFVSGAYGATIPGLVLLGAILPVLALPLRSWRWFVGVGAAAFASFGLAIALPVPHAATVPTQVLHFERGIQVAFWSIAALVVFGQVVRAYHRQGRRLSALNEELRQANKALDERNRDLEVADREILALRRFKPDAPAGEESTEDEHSEVEVEILLDR